MVSSFQSCVLVAVVELNTSIGALECTPSTIICCSVLISLVVAFTTASSDVDCTGGDGAASN